MRRLLPLLLASLLLSGCAQLAQLKPWELRAHVQFSKEATMPGGGGGGGGCGCN